MYVNKSLIVEVESYKLIEDLIQCEICKELLNNPIQCQKCENVFCSSCFEEFISRTCECPFKCKNPISKPCRIANNLLDNFSFKCINNCNSNIKYSHLEDHYHKICPNKNYKELIKSALVQINKFKQQNQQLNEQQQIKNRTPYHCESTTHHHPLVLLSSIRQLWICNVCSKQFSSVTKSYYCTLCDYDLCIDCYQKEKFLLNNF